MNWKTVSCWLLVGFMLTAVLTGCGGNSAKKPAAGVLRAAYGAEPETLDPRKAIGVPEAFVMHQLFEGLVALNIKNEYIPGVAERWETSADGLKWTFYLRPDAKWSNGDPVTARDFEYSWKSVLSPQLASRYAAQLYVLKNGEAFNKGKAEADQVGVKARNDNILEVTLEYPVPYFLSLVSFFTYYPVHKPTVEANEKWHADPKTIVGNGPFKMVSWVHNSKIELAPSEHYWNKGVVKLTKLELALGDSTKTLIDMFENNQLDDVESPPPLNDWERLRQENKMKTFPDGSVYHYMFNVTKPPFDNVKIRKAFALSVDRQLILSTLLKGGGVMPAYAWAPYGYPDARPGEDFRKVGGDLFKEDIALAKQLLAEAGYPDGRGFPEVTMLYNTSDMHKAIAEALQEMWKKNLGVNVKLTNQEWKVYLQARYQGDFQMARRGWVSDYLDPMTAMETMLGDNENNNTRWVNAQYDQLIKQAKSTLDSTARMKLMHDAEKILIDEMPFVLIFFDTKKVLQKPNVKGIIRNPLGSVYFREASIE